ncbi:hypothetical protein M885DRAFT_561221 [Pelagophyceae sp. CCMP2097]|nr:hypothetical protein M885DRAFT_561221 [Pelagophyceae sp. CCMP2097]
MRLCAWLVWWSVSLWRKTWHLAVAICCIYLVAACEAPRLPWEPRHLRAAAAPDARPLDVVFYTAAFGASYAQMANDWCAAMEQNAAHHVLAPRVGGGRKRYLVFTDDPRRLTGCARKWTMRLDLGPKPDSGVIKAVKFARVNLYTPPAKFYCWLDIDVRPTRARAYWFDGVLRDLAESQTLEGPTAIAMTPTRRDKGFNGGLFVYANRGCVDDWQRIFTREDVRSRDQRALRLATDRGLCNVSLLPGPTQTYFKNADALILRRSELRRTFDYAFVHLTGKMHRTSLGFAWLRWRGIY